MPERVIRQLQKKLIRRQIIIGMPECVIRQSCTPNIERSERIVILMLVPTLFGEVDASLGGSEGKDDAYDRFRIHTGGK